LRNQIVGAFHHRRLNPCVNSLYRGKGRGEGGEKSGGHDPGGFDPLLAVSLSTKKKGGKKEKREERKETMPEKANK